MSKFLPRRAQKLDHTGNRQTSVAASGSKHWNEAAITPSLHRRFAHADCPGNLARRVSRFGLVYHRWTLWSFSIVGLTWPTTFYIANHRRQDDPEHRRPLRSILHWMRRTLWSIFGLRNSAKTPRIRECFGRIDSAFVLGVAAGTPSHRPSESTSADGRPVLRMPARWFPAGRPVTAGAARPVAQGAALPASTPCTSFLPSEFGSSIQRGAYDSSSGCSSGLPSIRSSR